MWDDGGIEKKERMRCSEKHVLCLFVCICGVWQLNYKYQLQWF